MSVATLPLPKCTMGDAIDKLEDAAIDLDSARFALAFLMETARPEDHSADTIQCIMNTLLEAAVNLKDGSEAATFEYRAFKAWFDKNAQRVAAEARS